MSSTHQIDPSLSSAKPARRWRDIAILGGLFGLMLVGLIGLAAATGWEETWAQLMSLSMTQVLVLLCLSMVNYLFRGARWHMFANRLGLPTTLGQDLRHFLGGFAMTVTPGRVGELIRMRWLRRETGWSFERTAPLVLVDRAADLAAMAVILGVAISFSTAGIKGAIPVTLLAFSAAYVATRPTLLAWCVTRVYRATGLFPRLFAKVRRAADSLRSFTNPQILIFAALLGVIGWIAEGYAFHLLLVWMGADIGFWTAVAIFVFSTLAGGLTGAPGGVGGAEAAMVALLSLQGIPLEVSVPATLIIRVTTLWFAIAIGLVVFPIAERKSLRAE
ncbi:YbhN family protein [Nereida sp. MMG025]|uniref:lysylphosphatidylglycerol synthase transmembrane domain-containing protein n=1 Tax=Nereida sp. MMG025 TaxID=2909981 RepID=UPI00351CCF24